MVAVASGRAARLYLGNRMVPLDDPQNGYVCTSLDVGYPSVREVVNNRPDRHGTDDQTAFFGSRAVSFNLTAWEEGSTADDTAHLFAPFLVASARPILVWSTRSSVPREVFLTLRPADFSSAMTNASGGSIALRTMQLQFIAPDPVAWSMDEQRSTAYAGSSVRFGRVYDLTFDRQYPPGGRDPSVGSIPNTGDVPVSPLLRVFGPITGPMIWGEYDDAYGVHQTWRVVARPSLHVDPGGWVDIDTNAKTVVVGETCQNIIAQIDWTATTWPAIPAGSTSNLLIAGDSTTETTMVEARWRWGYLQ